MKLQDNAIGFILLVVGFTISGFSFEALNKQTKDNKIGWRDLSVQTTK